MSIESRRETMKEYLEDKRKLEQQLYETEESIKWMRKRCPHKNADGTSALKFKNSDSHHYYYECDICFEQIQE